MGNSASSGRGHHDETVDFGYLTPQACIYTGPRDWNQATVTQFIVERKLAPFYRPLEDYDESWDDDQILAARKELPEPEGGESSRLESTTSSARGHTKRPSAAKDLVRHPEAAIYRGAVECPICFLYYPSNINRSRCCDQSICTECFVQIKRVEPTTTHIVSEPAACPYCVQENFGVVYTPPPWRAGLGSEGATPPSWPDSPKAASDASGHSSMKRRRKSFGHNDPEVVTIDHIRPDWETKLAAVRAAVARRANRRIIMRQVGDRLIPVGVTSGRVHAIPTEDGAPELTEGAERGSRRSRRRQQNPELNQLLGSMGLGGQDLEELMVMEAMRLSLLEHEAQQRRQREEEARKQREEAAAAASGTNELQSRSSGERPSEPINTSTNPIMLPEARASESLRPQTGESGSASRSRTSTSSQNSPSSPPTSALLTPPPDRISIDQRSGRRSGRSTPTSQYGIIGAAVFSATSTASAVTSPSPERDSSDLHGGNEPVEQDYVSAPGGSHSHSEVDTVPTISEPSSDHTTDPAIPPPFKPQDSFASSLSPSYDALPSSPESTINRPLLDSAIVPTTPAVESDSDTPSTT